MLERTSRARTWSATQAAHPKNLVDRTEGEVKATAERQRFPQRRVAQHSLPAAQLQSDPCPHMLLVLHSPRAKVKGEGHVTLAPPPPPSMVASLLLSTLL